MPCRTSATSATRRFKKTSGRFTLNAPTFFLNAWEFLWIAIFLEKTAIFLKKTVAFYFFVADDRCCCTGCATVVALYFN